MANSRSARVHPGRWRKPRLYLTIAGISQLAALAMAVVFFSIGLDDSRAVDSNYSPTVIGWTLILSAPAACAAARLFQGRKIGIFISLAMVPPIGFALGMSVFSVLGRQGIDMLDKVLIDLAIASVLSILGPLLLGWKKGRWKSKRKGRKYATKHAASS
jgi:hypothetical protein